MCVCVCVYVFSVCVCSCLWGVCVHVCEVCVCVCVCVFVCACLWGMCVCLCVCVWVNVDFKPFWIWWIKKLFVWLDLLFKYLLFFSSDNQKYFLYIHLAPFLLFFIKRCSKQIAGNPVIKTLNLENNVQPEPKNFIWHNPFLITCGLL